MPRCRLFPANRFGGKPTDRWGSRQLFRNHVSKSIESFTSRMANVPLTASNRSSSFSSSTRKPLAPAAPRFVTGGKIGVNGTSSMTKVGSGGRGAGGMAVTKKVADTSTSVGSDWRPSAKIKSIKCADPFASKPSAFKTRFATVFHSGGIPCRLHHGAVNVRLQWSRDPATLDFDPLLVTCAEGLLETEHPYAYASRACFGELLAADNAAEKAIPLVARIVPSIRAALVSSNKATFEGGVEAARQLSEVVGESLNEHIHVFVVQMNKKSGDKDLAPKVMRAMQTFEEMGGPVAYKVIKAKVPTYCSVYI